MSANRVRITLRFTHEFSRRLESVPRKPELQDPHQIRRQSGLVEAGKLSLNDDDGSIAAHLRAGLASDHAPWKAEEAELLDQEFRSPRYKNSRRLMATKND